MSKLWMAFLPAIFSFGPIFMILSDEVKSFGAAFLVGMGLLSMFVRMRKQDQLIKEMQSQIGSSNEETVGS